MWNFIAYEFVVDFLRLLRNFIEYAFAVDFNKCRLFVLFLFVFLFLFLFILFVGNPQRFR